MKNLLTAFFALAAVLAGVSTVFAQGFYSGTPTTGLFGYRVIGTAPRGVSTPSMFGNRFVGPPANVFAYSAQNMANPGYRAYGSGPYSTAYLPPLNVTNRFPAATMENVAMELQPIIAEPPIMPGVYPQPIPEPYPVPSPVPTPTPAGTNGANGTGGASGGNGTQSMVPAPQALVSPSGIATPAAMNAAYPRGWSYAINPSRSHQGQATPSTELSNRMTQIARSRNMLVGQRIMVYIDGDTAVMEGTVSNTGDRDVLANVLSLEPRVRYIDNRLTTEKSAAYSQSTRSASRQ